MKSLNECIPIVSVSAEAAVAPTKYWELFRLTSEISLLLHLVTGAVDLIEEEEKIALMEMFEKNTTTHLTRNLEIMLKERGYLSDPPAEQSLIETLAVNHTKQARERSIEFFVCPTFACPVGCAYCFEGNLGRKVKTNVLTSEQIKSVFAGIEEIKNASDRELKEIVLFGGEPLLPITKTAVREILELATRRNYKVTICTSGIFIKEFVPMFNEFSRIVSLVRVTIDGPKDQHNALRTLPNSFERAVEGVDALLATGIPVMVRINVERDNIESIPELAEYFANKEWLGQPNFEAIVTGIKDRACAGDTKQILREDELAIRFLEMRLKSEAVRRLRPVNIFMSLRHLATNLGHLEGIVKIDNAVAPTQTVKFHGCGATDGTLYIFGTDDQVYVCTEAIGKLKLSVGIYHPRLDLDPKHTSKWQGWRKYNVPRCRECKYLLICGGTCVMSSVIKFGSGEKPICPPISQIIDGYISALSSQIVSMR